MSDEFQIQKQEVHERDVTPGKIFGYTVGEYLTFAGAFLVTHLLVGSLFVTLIVLSALWLYFKRKGVGQERAIPKFVSAKLRKHNIFRANARDSEWRPPVTPWSN